MRTCNAENMTQLVDALESNEYEQTQSVLRRDDQFCCLGVACDISGVGRWQKDGDDGFRYIAANDWSISVMPYEVSEWLGLEHDEYDSMEELPLNYDGHASAMNMNDTGNTFAEIAQAIRMEYLDGE